MNFDRNRILDSILDHIGGTPMVRINRIGVEEGLECELVAKLEFFNAGGSVKDRIGKRMMLKGIEEGHVTAGTTVIEPTSGNTGIGLALTAAVLGYKAIITLPEKMSSEKVSVLKALGAEIIRTPTEAAWDSPDSHIGVAKRLNKEIKNSWIPDQYSNINNPMAHYEGTAEEIYSQCCGKIDMFVAGAGTGGTIAGIGKRLKELIPTIEIVAIDPYGSILAQPESLNHEGVHSYQIEGIGYDFIPKVCDRSVVDRWIKTSDKESFQMSRRLIKSEGLLCGGSCGTAMVGAIKAAKSLKKGQRCVVLLPDSVRNYMTKFLDDEWMKKQGFTDSIAPIPWTNNTIRDLKLTAPVSIPATTTCKEAIATMQERGFDQLPVITDVQSNHLAGMVTLGGILAKLASNRAQINNPVSESMYNFSVKSRYVKINLDTKLVVLQKFFEKNPAAIVTGGADGLTVIGIVTKIDLLSFIMANSS